MTIHILSPQLTPPPQAYLSFIDRMRRVASSHGLDWHIELDSNGAATSNTDWDLRKLNKSHDLHVPGSCGFAVSRDLTAMAASTGWHPSQLPEGAVLGEDVQDFIKALIVEHCSSGRSTGDTQQIARAARRLFSLVRCPPWELSRENFDAVLGLKAWSDKPARDFSTVARYIDENLISVHCPVRPELKRKESSALLGSLQERQHAEKLPDLSALLELTRIVFQETPQTYMDAVRFGVVKLALFTGLRMEEVLTIPADCLVWDEHLDIVTGRPAGTVGGVSRSLRLHYYAEKHIDGAPNLLVEAHQHVPAMFEDVVVSTVTEMVEIVGPVRELLRLQQQNPSRFPDSDCRIFRTSSGRPVWTSDRLFLSLGRSTAGRTYPLQLPLQEDREIKPMLYPGMLIALGRHAGRSMFSVYGRSPESKLMSIKPHSLRHLMNTEMFRKNVPDTIITHQFGRRTVAQSYEYDHRNLAEKLSFVKLPPAASKVLPAGSAKELVGKMVVSGMALQSHLGQSFKRIQHESGDEAAFIYLAANADGFHVTPYGFCTNSFSVNPCTRHLKCFDQCKHFTASGVAEHRVTLEDLRSKLVAMRDAARCKPATTVGRKNQIAHAERLIAGVSAALHAQPNQSVFADGIDHSTLKEDIFK